MKTLFRTTAALCAAALLLLTPRQLPAAEAPHALAQLREKASHVVTGKVSAIEIRTEQSEIEGFCSFDFAIYCRIVVTAVEKGEGVKVGDELVTRCFRPKTRFAAIQGMSLQGHRPIPAPEQRVRAFLQREGLAYHTVHPNGFAPPGVGRLIEASEVRQLVRWSPFTFLLPLELWGLIGVGVVLLVPILAIFLAVFASRSRCLKVVKLVLAVPAALATLGASVGFVQFLAAIQQWTFGAGVVIVGVSAVAGFAALTVWLFRSAWRKPSAQADGKEAVAVCSALGEARSA